VANTIPVLNFELNDNTIVDPDVWINGTLTDPELPNQTLNVMLGIDSDPKLTVNLTNDSGEWKWSILLDLWALEEGAHELNVKAIDPFSTSIVKTLKIVLDIPNSIPLLTIDDVKDPLWGEMTFTGTALDDDEDILTVKISWDNSTWTDANVGDGQWNWTINASEMEETGHTLYVSLTDDEDIVLMILDVIVKGPMEAPILISSTPDTTIDLNKRAEQTFEVVYKAGDHRGVVVSWYLNDTKLKETTDSINLIFDEEGSQIVKVVIENAENSTLKVEKSWTVNVISTIKIEAKGETEITVLDEEAVILELNIVGEVEEIVWKIDGKEVTGSKDKEYINFLEEEAGNYTITAEVSMNDGTKQTITYSVDVPVKEPIGDDDDNGMGIGAVGLIAIGSVGLVLFLVIILVTVLVIKAVIKKKKALEAPPLHQGPSKGEHMEWNDEQPVNQNTPSPAETSGQQVPSDPFGQQPQTDVDTRQQTQPPVQQPAGQVMTPMDSQPPVEQTQPPVQQPAGQVMTPMNSQPPVEQAPPVQEMKPAPSAQALPSAQPQTQSTSVYCPTCGNPTQFYQDYNANWCTTCQSYV